MTLLVVLGPTGTGKSALALELAVAVGGEIVGCDALQVYRGLDRGTAKPTAEERARVPHHVIDVADPREDFSMGAWVRHAEAAIAAIAGRGRVPIVSGGTGMYLRALLRGHLEAPARDSALRERIVGIGERRGLPRLHRWLARLDPASAARLAPRDRQRIVRALELALAGRTWSARLAASGTWSSGRERYRAVKIGLDMDREALRAHLVARVERFFDEGLAGEVRALLAAGVPPSANAFKAIGYREVLGALLDGADPDAVRETVARHTWQYAKRQRTWFRREPGVTWLDAGAGVRLLVPCVLELWRRTAEA